MNDTKRTSGKWRRGKGGDASRIFLDDPQGGPSKTVAELRYHGWTRAEIKEHTEYIVRACNSHDALVAACQAALEWHAGYPHGNEEFTRTTSAYLFIRLENAIALARRPNDEAR